MDGASAPAATAEQMAPAPPTDSPDPVPQDPGLAGTLLLAETLLGPHLSIQALKDGKYHLVTHDTTQEIRRDTYDGLLSAHNAKRNSSDVSIASGITGLASHVSVKTEGDDLIEWGDMDPELASRLRKDPDALRAYKRVKQPLKQAILDPNLGKFAPIATPPTVASSSTANIETVTPENLKTTFEEYHANYISPALTQLSTLVQADLSNRITNLQTSSVVSRITMQSIESDLHKRTLIIHGVPPFSNKRSIDDNLGYLLYEAQLTSEDVQSVSNHLLTTSVGFLKLVLLREQQAKSFFTSFRQKKRYFRTKDPNNYVPDAPLKIKRDLSVLERLERQPMLALLDAYTKGVTEAQPDPIFTEYMQSDFNSLQIWTPDGSDLVSQVMYLPSGKTLVCHLAIQPPHKDHILATFPKFFQDRMVQTVKFLQAYINASRHSTTTARFHYSQTQDFSNISPKEAVSFFPYDVCPIDLDPDLMQTLKNPSSLLVSYSGLQSVIQESMQDHGIDPDQYGKGAKGKSKEAQEDYRPKDSGKGRGRGRTGKQSKPYESKGRGGSWQTGKGREQHSPPTWQTEAPWPSKFLQLIQG